MKRMNLAPVLAALALVGCGGVSKLDYTKIYTRAGWQHPERVVESLDLKPGDRVADLGAGDGYFLPYLVEAVGPTGTVYAVEVDEERTRELEKRSTEEGYSNVVVVLGEYSDPQLPDGEVDLVFVCNTYHHIEARPDYFSRLRTDLSDAGRVAIIDPDAEVRGVLRLFQHEGHMSVADDVVDEMQAAGYGRSESFDFLPTQVFEVFAPARDAG
jgi:cyclopropane fatty-acyl-phospholipid synthase-like methyltransferase